MLRREDFDLENGFVRCAYCQTEMPRPKTSGKAAAYIRTVVPLPKGVTVRQTGDGVEILRRWLTPKAYFMVIFCIIWNGFLCSWYMEAFNDTGNASLVTILFPLIHVGIGVVLTYWTIATFFNTTRVAVEHGLLKVSHGPMPWPGNLAMDANEVVQLYCRMESPKSDDETDLTYDVWVLLRDGESKKLLSAGPREELAFFIEQEIEKGLNLEHQHISGSMVW